MNAIITCHSQVCSGQAATQTHRQVTATSEALIPICPAAQLQQDAVTYMESLPPFGMLDRAALPVKQRSRLSDLTACESPGHVCIHSVSGGCKTSSACPATCLLLYVGLSVGCGCHTHESHGSLRCPPPVWCVECGVGTRAFLECSGVVTHTHTHMHGAWECEPTGHRVLLTNTAAAVRLCVCAVAWLHVSGSVSCVPVCEQA